MVANIKDNHIALPKALLITGRRLIYDKGEKEKRLLQKNIKNRRV